MLIPAVGEGAVVDERSGARQGIGGWLVDGMWEARFSSGNSQSARMGMRWTVGRGRLGVDNIQS